MFTPTAILLIGLTLSPTPAPPPSTTGGTPGLSFDGPPPTPTAPVTSVSPPSPSSIFLPPPEPPPEPSPRPTPTPPEMAQLCECLRWTYAPHSAVNKFQFLVSQVSQHYPQGSERAELSVEEQWRTEIPCAQLVLYAHGRYYTVVRAVGKDGTPSEPSNEVCLEVYHGVTYVCPDQPVENMACTHQGS